MSRETDNPAGRLYALLQRGRTGLGNPGKVSTGDAWNRLLRGPDEEPLDPPTLMRRFAAVWQLPSSVREAVDAVDDFDHALLLAPLPPIERALQISFGQPWAAVLDHLPEHVMTSLLHCAEVLHHRATEAAMLDDEVQELLGEVRSLIDAVATSDLSPELRSLLVNRLRDVEDALVNVRVSGPAGVQRAAETTLGAAGMWWQVHPSDVPTGEAWKRTWEVLRRVYVATMVAKATLELGEGFADVIEGFRELGSGQ